MSHHGVDSAVLPPVSLNANREDLRRRLDRRHLLAAIALGLLIHAFLVLGFWLYDVIQIRQMGEWSGPIVVKLGSPQAPEAPLPDVAEALDSRENPVPEEVETPQPRKTSVDEAASPARQAAPEEALDSRENPVPEEVETPQPRKTSVDEAASPAMQAAPEEALDSRENPVPEEVETPQPRKTSVDEAASPAEAKPESQPVSRVRGKESGNSYEINFDGSEGDVGRAGAYEFITSYMPLPEILDSKAVDEAKEYLTMSPQSIRDEILRYWEPGFNGYTKKPGSAGTIALDERPYYWSLLIHSLGYDASDPDWRSPGMRPVVVEFTVDVSRGASGAVLKDFVMISRTNDPQIDEAVVYGLSRWVYYNDTGGPVKGRITYSFDD